MEPSVVEIYIAEQKAGPPKRMASRRVIAGQGLVGDRYTSSAGTFSSAPGDGRNLTMIDSQVTRSLGLANGASRRNIEVQGINPRTLVGSFFTVGNVLAYGVRPCEPCKHLADLLERPDVVKELAGRDGLRADVLSSGEISEGSSIQVLGSELKVYLDDERPTPEGWYRVFTPNEAIEVLKSGKVDEISLDHDLGDDDEGTGNDVVLWIEELVAKRGFRPPSMSVHSANVWARQKMEAGIGAIMRLHADSESR